MIDLLLVDDHELVRTGIRRLLEDQPGVRVCGEADSGETAIRLVKQKRPDVVLMDLNMPGMGGLEATRKMVKLYRSLPVIIVSVHMDDPFPSRLMQAGAMGYISKGASVAEMMDAIRSVYEGRRYISRDVAQHVALSVLPGKEGSPLDNLSERELQVMMMLVQGEKIQEISEKLSLSPKTVSTYRSRLFAKLGVKNDASLARIALRHGMVNDIDQSIV